VKEEDSDEKVKTAHGDEDEEDEEREDGKLSKRQRKKVMRLSVAELKQLVARPDVVEVSGSSSSSSSSSSSHSSSSSRRVVAMKRYKRSKGDT